MSNTSKIIVVTGAESTGKSTLAKALANYFEVPYIPEYARDYIQNLKEEYTYSDVELIARKQTEQLKESLKLKEPIIILDTWLLITKVWFEVVFKSVPDWIENEIKNTHIDLWLVCDTDLPWVADDVRENGGENRSLLHEKYIGEIEKYNYSYKIINGDCDSRVNNAIQAISKLEYNLV